MASRDIVNNTAKVQLLAPQNVVASPLVTVNSKALDTQGFESAMVIVSIGALTGVDGSNYATLTLQESDDSVGAHFTNVAQTPNSLGGTASSNADFGDQERPFGSSLTSLLPAPATMPTLYQGFTAINAAGSASTQQSDGYLGYKRYLRVQVTFTGAPTTINLEIMGIMGHAQFEPVTSPSPVTTT